MPKAYSVDLRERVIEAVETGASRREAAERFEVSVSSAVKWLQGWREKRSAAPKLRGGSISPLEEFATEILALVGEQPDRTLVETVATLRKRRIKTSRSSLWRFFDRHNITLKNHLGLPPPVGVETAEVYPLGWKGAADGFLVAGYPAKKHGPWVVAHVRVVTPSGDPV